MTKGVKSEFLQNYDGTRETRERSYNKHHAQTTEERNGCGWQSGIRKLLTLEPREEEASQLFVTARASRRLQYNQSHILLLFRFEKGRHGIIVF